MEKVARRLKQAEKCMCEHSGPVGHRPYVNLPCRKGAEIEIGGNKVCSSHAAQRALKMALGEW
jgi:hypothetical protein